MYHCHFGYNTNLTKKPLHDNDHINTLTPCHVMSLCINVIHDTIFNVTKYLVNYQGKKHIRPFSTFLGNLCRANPCCKHLPSKLGDCFMIGVFLIKKISSCIFHYAKMWHIVVPFQVWHKLNYFLISKFLGY